MKRLATLTALLCLATAQAVWAQPRPGGPGGAGGPGGGGRGFEERRAQRQDQRREQFERRPAQSERTEQRSEPRNERNESGGQRMSPDERRALREQIRDHGRDIYRGPPRDQPNR